LVVGRGAGVELSGYGAESDSSQIRRHHHLPKGGFWKVCLKAGDFPRRPLEDSFNSLPDSDIAVAYFGLHRRQKL
jgi:hypothetical protein